MMLQTYLSKLIEGDSLTRNEATEAMDSIMSGDTPATQIAAFLVAMRMKGENSEEVTGFVESMRSNATPINTDAESLLDMCGTGGDGAGTFNISTIASIVAAAGGISVAKHGNRAVSSKCGSADLFNALGVNIEMPVERLGDCLNETGYAFLFAPLLHPAMKHAIGTRRELKIRTVFNLLGPMTNPASPTLQLLGVYDFELAELVAEVLRNIGVKRALVVHGSDGLDEITLTGKTMCVELDGDHISRLDLTPGSFGLPQLSTVDISGEFEPDECALIATKILSGEKGPKRDIVVANSAVGLYLGGKEDSIGKAARLAEDLLDSGKALELLENFSGFTNRA